MQRPNLTAKQLVVITCIFLAALVGEFILLEGTIGVSLPSDRYSALSSVEIKPTALELHFITHNTRFTVVPYVTLHGSIVAGPLVLRESFFMDRDPDREGPPNATITVEAMDGEKVRWTFHERGERGELATDNLYRVRKDGCCGGPNIYTYFSFPGMS
jgi:hypothetical protein